MVGRAPPPWTVVGGGRVYYRVEEENVRMGGRPRDGMRHLRFVVEIGLAGHVHCGCLLGRRRWHYTTQPGFLTRYAQPRRQFVTQPEVDAALANAAVDLVMMLPIHYSATRVCYGFVAS